MGRRISFSRLPGLLGRDRRGAALVEFAILAMPLLMVLMAIFEVSLYFFSQQALETATDIAARRLVTGEVQRKGIGRSQFKADTCAAMPVLLRCANLYVDVNSAASFAAVSTSRPPFTRNAAGTVTNDFGFNPGGSGAVVVTRLIYAWPIKFGITNLFDNSILVATSVTRTENY